MLNFLRARRREAEWMDEPDADLAALDRSLAYIRRINRVLGYTRVILKQLEEFSVQWKPAQIVDIVDIGTGSADIPVAILAWADRKGLKVRVTGVDLNPSVVRLATKFATDPRLTLVQGDALHLPFADRSFDYAITSMFLHHLGDAEAERALAEMGRVASRGVIASDLLRLKRSYVTIWLLTLWASPMVKHDARVSVAQSFSRSEIEQIRNRAGIGFTKYHLHLMHRFVLAGERAGENHERKSE